MRWTDIALLSERGLHKRLKKLERTSEISGARIADYVKQLGEIYI